MHIYEPNYTVDGFPVRTISFGLQDWSTFGGIGLRSPTYVYFAGAPDGADEWLAIGVGDEVSDEIAERSVRDYEGGEERLRTLVPYLGELWEEFDGGDAIAFQFVLVQRRTDQGMLEKSYEAIRGLPTKDIRLLRDVEHGQIISDSIRDL